MKEVNKILYNQYHNNIYTHKYSSYYRTQLYFNLIIKKRNELNGIKCSLLGPVCKLYFFDYNEKISYFNYNGKR